MLLLLQVLIALVLIVETSCLWSGLFNRIISMRFVVPSITSYWFKLFVKQYVNHYCYVYMYLTKKCSWNYCWFSKHKCHTFWLKITIWVYICFHKIVFSYHLNILFYWFGWHGYYFPFTYKLTIFSSLFRKRNWPNIYMLLLFGTIKVDIYIKSKNVSLKWLAVWKYIIPWLKKHGLAVPF